MKTLWRLIGVVALAVLVVPAATAQETRASIEGVVKDASGAVLPGATVEAKISAQSAVQTATSDAQGIYRFPGLAPATYEVTASLTGFAARKVEGVVLRVGQLLQVNFALAVAKVSEEIEVTAESPIIDVKQNAASTSIQKEVIDRIPKGRNFPELLSQAPGAANEAKSGGTQIDGASGSENRFVVDGLDTTSLRNGTSQKEVLTDFLEELQVKSSGYNAEFRATTGGVINVITRSGSNRYSGSIGTYYQDNKRWAGAVRPTLRLNPSNQTIAEYIRTPLDPSYNLEPVGDIGGPIFRDRMWFFAGYIPQLSRTTRTVTFNSNQVTRSFDSKSEDHNLNYNVTAQPRDNIRVRFTGSNERTIGGQSLPGKEPNGTSNSTFAQFPNPVTSNSSNDLYAGEFSWVVSPKFFVGVNTGYLTYNSWQVTQTEFQTQLRHVFSGSNTSMDIPQEFKQLNGYSDLAASTRNVRDKFGRYGLTVDGTYFANRAGRHTLKAGIQFERLTNDVLTGAQAPTVTLNWNASRTTLDDTPRIVRGTYGFYTVARFFTAGNIHSNNLGFFLQDAWSLSDRLTINLGLRSDSETIPSYRPENPGLEFGLGDKIAPRAGFAYDVKGDGKWKAYGSWGMFYDISKLEMPRGAWGAERWIDYHYTLDTFNWPSINCEGPVGSGCPGTFIELADRRHVSNEPGNFLVDPDIKPIRTQELTFGVDHQLMQRMSVGVRYAHKWLDRTIEDVGIQQAGVGEIFMIANPGFGIAERTLAASCPTCPAQPKAERTYDGLEFRLEKRLSGRWEMLASYLYSRIYGNYSGLSSSDENGRNSPSVLRFFDGLYMSFDQTGQPLYGLLQTDRPHQLKLRGSYELPWNFIVGADYLLESGTPQQSTVNIKSVPVFDEGRGNLGRSPAFSRTNLALTYRLTKLPGGKRATLNLDVANVFDQDTSTRIFTTRYRDALPVSDATFFSGFNAQGIAAATPAVRNDPRFTLDDQFLSARRIRVMAKLFF
jgi:outer membrane receptor protein involved in Fe transport